MKERLQFMLSAILMVLVGLSGYGQSFTVEGITYEITSTAPARVEITGYDTNSGTEVTIPPMVSDPGTNTDYDVTAIDNDAFHDKQLTKLIFSPQSKVTRIGERAFRQNNLNNVEIPESITRIEQGVFALNDLRELTILASVEHIGEQAFLNNLNLSMVTVERNPATTIHATAFFNAGLYVPGRTDLVVPFGAIQAYENAGWTDFVGTITSGITTIDGIKYGITTSPVEATVVGNIGNNYNLSIPPRVDIDGITYPVTAIGDGALPSVAPLPLLTVIIPETVRSIGARAFHRSHLNRVTVEANEPPTLDPDAFEYPHRTEIQVIVPEGREQAYKDAGWTGFRSISSLLGRLHRNSGFHWRVTSVWPNEMELEFYEGPYDNGHLEIPSEVEYLSIDNSTTETHGTYSVTSIGKAHLGGWWRQGNSRLTSVEIPIGVTHIGDSTFTLSQLTYVNIPDAVTHIGESAFAQSQLTNVEIPESLTSMGEQAFAQNELTSVEIPDGVTNIGEYAFAQNQLTSVEISDNVTNIREGTFSDNQLTEVTIPGNVTDIGLYAFFNNPDLHLVTVEATDPPRLHKDAFSNAYRGQIDLVVPDDSTIQAYLDNGWDGFRSISYGIFTVDNIKYAITSRTEVMVVDYTGTATEVTIPETADNGEFPYTVTAIRKGAFQNKGLTDVGIPVSVTSIGEGAFSDNKLAAVTIPSSVERIAGHAFYNNPDLALVTVEAHTPPALHPTAFANANRHQIDLVVPTDRIQVYEANGWDGFKSVSESTPPLPTLDAPLSIDHLNSFTVNITFDSQVTDFDVDDIQVTNAVVNTLTGSGFTYTATVEATSLCDGDITIDVPANVAMGANRLPNMSATQLSVGTEDTIDPTISCLANVVANTADHGIGDCTTTLDLGKPVVEDNCSVASVVAQVNGTDIDPDSYAFGIGATTVTWVVSDGTGNTASCEQTVTVEATGNCAPEPEPIADFNRGFSPNGDGIADTLVIEGLEHYKNNVVKIYDQSQRLLFSAHYGGPGDAWDGTQRGGDRVPVGSYVCVIDYNEPGLGHEAKMIYVNY